MIAAIFAGSIGISQGILCGAALCAVLRVLGVFTRLQKKLNSQVRLDLFALAGAVLSTVAHLFEVRLFMPRIFASIIGLGSGIYLGMMTASLAELTYIIPGIAQKLNMPVVARAVAIAWLIGKTAGSFMYWIEPLWQH